MKKTQLLLSVLLVFITGYTLQAQNQPKTKSESIKVLGNCDMCKTRIEKAARSEGVSTASWDSKTKLLTLTFDPSKTNADAVAKKVAAVGHDTEKFKSEEKVYNALPGCCKYDRSGKAATSGHTH